MFAINYDIEVDKISHIMKLVSDEESDDNQDIIQIYLSSRGGDVDAAFAISNILRMPDKKTEIICNGVVASSAILFLPSVDNVVAFENTKFIFHGYKNHYENHELDVHGLREEVKELESDIKRRKELFETKYSKETVEQLEKWHESAFIDTVVSAQKLKELGVIDEIICFKTKEEIEQE